MIETSRLFERLAVQFGAKLAETTVSQNEPVIRVAEAAIREVLTFLRNDEELAYNVLVDLFGIDRTGSEPRFEIVYILRSPKHNGRIIVKTGTSEAGVETVSDLWFSADWLEREVFDMFGVHFKNHPDLRRIYTDDDFDGHPLRKDFPVEGADFDKPFTVHLEEEKI